MLQAGGYPLGLLIGLTKCALNLEHRRSNPYLFHSIDPTRPIDQRYTFHGAKKVEEICDLRFVSCD